jgi:hypothetical protein
MEQPQGFAPPGCEHLVSRLRKSLYGLKQAPRQWYRKFDDFVRSINFLWSDKDHCFYSKDAPDGNPIYLILYVDDMLLSGVTCLFTHDMKYNKLMLAYFFDARRLRSLRACNRVLRHVNRTSGVKVTGKIKIEDLVKRKNDMSHMSTCTSEQQSISQP